MPQLQNIVLTDRASTPVSHTYVPLDIKNGVGAAVETSGVPIGNNTLKVSTKKTGTGRYKSVVSLTLPIVQTQTINGISTPVVVRTSYASIDFSFDGESTLQERNDCVGLLMSALDPSKVLVNDAVVKLQGVY